MDPRLHVLTRPETSKAVVIRWGPARVYCTIGWDLRTDEFSVGQWCKHKLYPRRCDISPDGRFLVYFALNGRWRSETRGSWAALSFAPYLRALRLWPQGDTWGGGGIFFSADQLPAGCRPAPQPPLPDDTFLSFGAFGGYPQRLRRDGWNAVPRKFVKSMDRGWSLQKLPRDEPRESHALLDASGRVVQDLAAWQWAEWDAPRRRVVWADAGVLYAAKLTRLGVGHPEQLFDARGMVFEPIEAPYQCKTVFAR